MRKILFCCLALFSFHALEANIYTGWDFDIDWLYWNLRKSDLDYAVDGHTGSGFPDGKIKYLEVDYNHGFRINLLKDCGPFDTAVRYTYFRTDDNHRSTERIGDLVPTRLHPGNAAGIGDINTLDYARAGYKADIDIADLEFGKKFVLFKCLTLRPHFGFSYAHIDQKMKTIYQEDEQAVVTGVRVDEKLDMNGYGLTLGGTSNFSISGCYSLFGRFSAALYTADFKGLNSEHQYDGPIIGEGEKGERLVHASGKQTLVVGSYSISVGIAYDLCSLMCMDWTLSAGYEFHQWCGLPNFIHFTDDSARGILTWNSNSLGWDGLFLRAHTKF